MFFDVALDLLKEAIFGHSDYRWTLFDHFSVTALPENEQIGSMLANWPLRLAKLVSAPDKNSSPRF